MEDILQPVVQLKAQNKIIILDRCHSGAFGSPQLNSGAAHLTEGMVILTASRDVEKASCCSTRVFVTSTALLQEH